MPERIEARAPTRIDLGGGTVDLWPLYLLHQRPITVNAAIDLYARAVIERTARPGIEIISLDRGTSMRASSVADLTGRLASAPPDLEFLMRLAAHFLGPGRPGGSPGEPACRITTECLAPAGSGLGGSSTLGIALASALDRFVRRGLGPEALLAVTRAIETQVLRIPTGEQDYHPALRGGPLALHYTVEGTRIERLPIDLEALRRRIVLIDTGRPRSSGISNWDMMKRHLDGDGRVRTALDRVISATHAIRSALIASDWDGAAAALAEEWEARKTLSPTVSNDWIEQLIEGARRAGASAAKICGAGGGGCLVLWAAEGRQQAIREKVISMGARNLEVRFTSGGVETTEGPGPGSAAP
ncbi:MAG TPA: GHMP kinase [Candidatus Polarisedimenticolia bacterium]